MDRAVEQVREAAASFAGLSLDERIALVDSIQRGTIRVAAAAVTLSCRTKGITPGTALEGEEWATGPACVVRHLRLLRESLSALKERGNTVVGKMKRNAAGRVSVRIFPLNAIDRILLHDTSVDVYMEEGIDEEQVEAGRARFYRRRHHDGRVVLVLGAGNIASIAPMDVLSKLFNEGKVCVLKMNPTNAYLGPVLEEAFAEVIQRNYLAVVYGSVDEGAYLCAHKGIDEIHLTGSDKSHDRMVWGAPGGEQEERRVSGEPKLIKEITSELGNVSPVIIVPGPYSDRELRAQAEDIAGYATMNASLLCNTAKVIVTPAKWPGRVPFVRHLEDVLARLPTRRAYYPDTVERWLNLTSGRARLRTFGEAGAGRLPWALITWLDPENRDEPFFREESFCPVLTETSVGSPDPLEFLFAAVRFVNERLWGTLSATLVIHPRSLRDRPVAAAIEEAILALRYGTVAVNGYPGMSYGIASPPWGAFPGSDLADIQSGRGWVHNTSMLEGVEKVVFRRTLTTFPKPLYAPGHRSLRLLMRRLTALESRYSWRNLPGVMAAALQG
jgi:aldehyde dehydrogenase (NAD(P)+)